MSKHVYIHTMGCQMNVYDSEKMASLLSPLGYQPTDKPELADLIILNTCSIREKSQQKVYSFLGRLSGLKQSNPDLIIGVGGCVAQQEGQNMLKRVPHLDMVFGTRAIGRLPDLVAHIASGGHRVVDVDMTEALDEFPLIEDKTSSLGATSRFVTIMRGCDNFCTYCVVPHVRGREVSRRPDSIIEEIQELVRHGAREVTLLGQNVNSYGKKQGLCSFAQLLERIDAIEGLDRIRFTTSHPKDLSDDLIRAFGKLDKLCPHIHLPVQAGSNQVLKRMNRKYTREEYLDKIDKLRQMRSDMAITSDFIVGFPGETRKDFEQTLELIRRVRYDSVYAFKYSDRPQAAASGFSDKIAEDEKGWRLSQLLELQESITLEIHQSLVGTVQQVLVDGPSKKQEKRLDRVTDSPIQWTGRTPANKIINFCPDKADGNVATGKLVWLRVEKAYPHSLWGSLIYDKSEPSDLKGENCYAA